MPGIRFGAVIAEFAHVDDPDALDRSKSSPALQFALEMTRPRNWWGSGVDHQRLLKIARDDGIPLAWVPRVEVIRSLSLAETGEARMRILVDMENEILQDCESAVDICRDPWIEHQAPLVSKALKAHRGGHPEAAMALAVSVGEPLAIWASTPRVMSFESRAEREKWEKSRARRSYGLAQVEIAEVGVDIKPYQFKRQVLIAPIPRFFTPWWPDGDTPAPSSLSRHVVAHRATVDHFTRENSLLSIMLASSILRDQHEWCLEVRTMEDFDDE